MGIKSPKNQTKKYTLGLLIDRIYLMGTYQHCLWLGIINEARKQGVNVICFTGGTLNSNIFDRNDPNRNVIYGLVNPENVDGIIISTGTIGLGISSKEIAKYCDRFHPLPIISISTAVERTTSILTDNKAGLRSEIAHLVTEHQCQRIAFICGPEDHFDNVQRYSAYVEALAEFNIPLRPELVLPGNFLVKSGYAAINRFLDERKVSFDAVIGANDNMALGALTRLKERGFKIPQEVAVVGFDNIDDSRMSDPPLTTVEQPIQGLGKKAVDLLMRHFAGEDLPDCVTLPNELVIRQSCGCTVSYTGQQYRSINLGDSQPDTTGVFINELKSQITEMIELGEIPLEEKEKYKHGITQLIPVFFEDLAGSKELNSFTRKVDEIFRQVLADKDDPLYWCDLLSTLSEHILTQEKDLSRIQKAFAIWQEVWSMMDEVSQIAQAQRKISADEQSETTHLVCQKLVTSFDLSKLIETVVHDLPSLDIEQCWLVIYENPDKPLAWARLMVCYNKKENVQLAKEGYRFPSPQVIPQQYRMDSSWCNRMIYPLTCQNSTFGYIIFGLREFQTPIIELIPNQISTALKGMKEVRELKKVEDELARSNQELDQFAYIASHDLQEPLRMVRSYLQFLERRYKGQLDDQADQYINQTLKSAAWMHTLIVNLLNLSRIVTRGKPPAPVSGDEIVKSALTKLAFEIEDTEAKITYEEPLPIIMGDDNQLVQLMHNIIDNALKFRHAERVPEINIQVQKLKGYWQFSIQDNGIGIDSEHFQDIFIIFRKIHKDKNLSGVGMGLSIGKKIVDRHGGKIWLDAKPGEGSTFYFTIPR